MFGVGFYKSWGSVNSRPFTYEGWLCLGVLRDRVSLCSHAQSQSWDHPAASPSLCAGKFFPLSFTQVSPSPSTALRGWWGGSMASNSIWGFLGPRLCLSPLMCEKGDSWLPNSGRHPRSALAPELHFHCHFPLFSFFFFCTCCPLSNSLYFSTNHAM